MSTTQIQERSHSELHRLAELLRPRIEAEAGPEAKGKYLAINVDYDIWEIDRSSVDVIERLRVRCPTGEIWLTRVGFPTAFRM